MYWYISLAYILTILYAFSYATPNNGYQILELYPSSRDQSDALYKLSENADAYDFITLSKVVEAPAPKDVKDFKRFLLEHHIRYKVLQKNIGHTIDEEYKKQNLLRKIKPYKSGRLSTDRYYTHDEINSYLDDLAARFPTRAFVKRVGVSYEGRILKTITITNGDKRANKNVIFVDGGFHARDWISIATAVYVIEQLVDNFTENSHLLQDYEWIVLPVVNPDGYEYTQTSRLSRYWRKTRQPHQFLNITCYGADPNRNFDFHWLEGGASDIACVDTYAGPTPFSESEAVVVRDLLHTFKNRGAMYLTLHSYGNYLLYPWGWTRDLPSTWEDLDEVVQAGGAAIANATGTQYTMGTFTNVLYKSAGGSYDYAFSVGFPISIIMKLTGGGTTGYDPPVEQIDPFVKEAWIGIHAMAVKVLEKYPLGSLS